MRESTLKMDKFQWVLDRITPARSRQVKYILCGPVLRRQAGADDKFRGFPHAIPNPGMRSLTAKALCPPFKCQALEKWRKFGCVYCLENRKSFQSRDYGTGKFSVTQDDLQNHSGDCSLRICKAADSESKCNNQQTGSSAG